ELAEALERGWHFRRAGHSTLRRIMDAGAKGCLITIAGKLTGGRKRTEKFLDGHIKWCGDTALEMMDYGYATAKKKLGIIGCSVAIMRRDSILPDEVTIHGGAAPQPGEARSTFLPGSQPPTASQQGDINARAARAAVATAAAAGQAEAAPAAAPAIDLAAAQLTDLEGIGPAKAKHLKEASYETLADLDEATLDDIAEGEGIGPRLALKSK